MIPVLTLIPVVALAGLAALALLAPLLARYLGRNAGYPLAVGFAAIGVLVNVPAPEVVAGGAVTASWQWLPALDIAFALRFDGLAGLFSTIVLGVGALIMAYCPRYLGREEPHGVVYGLLTAFAAAMLGLVLADDLILLYVFWELTTILSFLLISTAGPKAAAPAGRALLVTAGGGFALLGGVVLLAVAAGTTDLGAILADPDAVLASPLAVPAAALIVIAAFTKSAQLPFGFWLPGAMVAMTPVSAYLHAATMVKAGIYLLMRFSPLFATTNAWSMVLIGVGLATAVVGALLALRENDLKAILAQSTVSQLGLLVAAIGVGTPLALGAAILHTFAHALFKATLFMLVGIIDHEAGSRDVRELGGLRRVMPVTATLTGLAALSMAGVPPLIGFVSKETLFEGFLEADFATWAGPVAATLAVTASALTFAYSMRIFFGAFGGELRQPRLYEPARAFLVPAAIAAVAGLLLGPAVNLLNPLATRTLADLAVEPEPTEFALWHGFNLPLLLSVITIAAGVGLFLARDRVDAGLQRLRVPDGAAVFDRGRAAVLRLGALVGRPDRDPTPAAVLLRPLAALPVLAVVGVVGLGALPEPASTSRLLDWPLLAVLAVSVAGAVATRSVLVAVALLGVAGLVVSLWFLVAGAPDVALTLLLVEVLTTVVAVLVLRGRRGGLGAPERARRFPAAILALGAGAVAGLAVFALTGRRGRSEAGGYFLGAAEPETGGTNVVNTILVDFRGADTFGEAVVVGAAALGLLALISRARATPQSRVARDGPADILVMRVASQVLAPGMFALSAFLLLRGHDEPGGGFIAALVAGVAVFFLRLAHRTDSRALRRLRPEPLVGTGLLLSLLVGLGVQLVGEPFLTPLSLLPGLSTSLIFDVGIYLMVLGLMVAAVERIGGEGRSGASLEAGPPARDQGVDDPAGHHAGGGSAVLVGDAAQASGTGTEPADNPQGGTR